MSQQLRLVHLLVLAVFLCSFQCEWITVRSDDCKATVTLNFQLEMPHTYLAPLSSVPPSNLQLWANYYAAIASTQAAMAMQNDAMLQQNPLAINFPTVFNQNISFGGICFSVNLLPKHELVLIDYLSEDDFGENAVQSVEACAHTNTTMPKGIVLYHGTQQSEDLFDSTSVICNAYDVTTLTFLMRDKDYSRLNEVPQQVRTIDLPIIANAPLLRLMNQFKWTRFAVIASSLAAISDALAPLEATATAAGFELTSYLVEADTSCMNALDEIVANDWKIIYFMPTVQNAVSCLNEFYARNLSANNFILIFSQDFSSTVLDDWPALQNYINFNLSALSGHLIMTGNVNNVYPTEYFLPFMTYIYKFFAQWNVNPNYIAYNFVTNYLMEQGIDVAAQGILGMLGERLSSVKSQYPSSSSSSGNATTATVAQQFVTDFLFKFTSNAVVDSSGVSIVPAPDNAHFNVSVNWGAIGYNLTRTYYYMTNNSGAFTTSALEANLHYDQNGVHLTDMFLGNIQGINTPFFSMYSSRYSTEYALPFSGYVWPNNSLLSTYANGWPSDRAPPTKLQLQCLSCTGQSALFSSTPVTQAPVESVIFSGVPNLETFYELDVFIDTPLLYTFQGTCDGTAPLTYSLYPDIASLVSIAFTASNGVIQVSSAQLFTQLTALYAANPSAFKNADNMPTVSASELLSLNGSTAAAAVIGVVNADNNQWTVNFVLNCNNGANNVSSIFTIVTHGLPDIYTPSLSEQAGLVAVNSLGLALTCAFTAGVIYFRHSQVVFSSSFLFLLIILLGFGLLFISALLSVVTATAAICQAKTFAFHFGFTITLGALFSKTYRLHRIFNSRTIQMLTITNSLLVGVLALLVLIDAIIIILWIEVSGIQIESSSKAHCYTSGVGNNIFPAIFTGLKGAVIMMGIYFTFKVRAVPANFNESRYIAIVIYNSAVLGILYVVVAFGTSLQPNELAVFTSAVLFVAAFVNMCVFFGSKVFAVGTTYWKSSGTNSSSMGTMLPRNHSAGKSAKDLHIHARTTSKGSKAEKDKEKEKAMKDGDDEKRAEEGDYDSDQETDVKLDKRQRTRRKLQRERHRFLQTVFFVKQREMERMRVQRRNDEIQSALSGSYDSLRSLVIKLKLNSMKLQRIIDTNKGSVNSGITVASASTPSEDTDDAALMKDIDLLLTLPLDELEVDANGQNYVVLHGNANNHSSRRMIVNNAPSAKNSKLSVAHSNDHGNSELQAGQMSGPGGVSLELQQCNSPTHGKSPHHQTRMSNHDHPKSDDSQNNRPGSDPFINRNSVTSSSAMTPTTPTITAVIGTTGTVPLHRQHQQQQTAGALPRHSSITTGSSTATRNAGSVSTTANAVNSTAMLSHGSVPVPVNEMPVGNGLMDGTHATASAQARYDVRGTIPEDEPRTKSFI